MPFKPGESGNPNGRPKKHRGLSEALEKAGSKTVEVDGKRVSGKNLAAQMAWELVTTGSVTVVGGRKMQADLDEWLAALKWIYGQVDGPPKQELEHSGEGGGPLTVRVVYDDGD